MVELLDLDDDQFGNLFGGNLFAQLGLVRELLPRMIERGGGTVINMISATAHATPKHRIGSGGWGMGYAMTKAAFARMAPLLEVEHGDDGIRAFQCRPRTCPHRTPGRGRAGETLRRQLHGGDSDRDRRGRRMEYRLRS